MSPGLHKPEAGEHRVDVDERERGYTQRMSKTRTLLFGGTVVGTFDICYAITFWAIRAGVKPMRVFQSVAAGLLGRPAALAGGIQTAILGGFLHYFIATMVVIVYFVASRWIPLLVKQPIIFGLLYGVGVWVVMNYVVIPLSRTSRGANIPVWIVCSIIVHALLIGLPAALFSARVAVDQSNAMTPSFQSL